MASPDERSLGLFLQEQRSTNMRQCELIRNQQYLIDLLAQILEENGLGGVLDTNGTSRSEPKKPSSSADPFSRTFGPTSAPIIWTGSETDAIPVTINGVTHKAQILTDNIVTPWNEIMDLWVRHATIRRDTARKNKSKTLMEGALKMIAEGQTYHMAELGQTTTALAEVQGRLDELDTWLEDTRYQIWDALKSVTVEVMYPFFLRHKLRAAADPTEWMDELFAEYDNRPKQRIMDEETADVFEEGPYTLLGNYDGC